MHLSIVYPAYNEALNIEPAVDLAFDYLKTRNLQGEVVVVNDGSRDDTANILSQLSQKYGEQLKVLHHEANQGYGATLRDGFLACRSQWIFYTDSDLQFDLQEIDQLWEHKDKYDLVVGYRVDRKDPWLRIFLAGGYNCLVRLLLRTKLKDVDCAFKLFHRSVFNKIQIDSKRFLVDAEIIAKARKFNLNIFEIGVSHRERRAGVSTVKWIEVFRTFRDLIILKAKL